MPRKSSRRPKKVAPPVDAEGGQCTTIPPEPFICSDHSNDGRRTELQIGTVGKLAFEEVTEDEWWDKVGSLFAKFKEIVTSKPEDDESSIALGRRKPKWRDEPESFVVEKRDAVEEFKIWDGDEDRNEDPMAEFDFEENWREQRRRDGAGGDNNDDAGLSSSAKQMAECHHGPGGCRSSGGDFPVATDATVCAPFDVKKSPAAYSFITFSLPQPDWSRFPSTDEFIVTKNGNFAVKNGAIDASDFFTDSVKSKKLERCVSKIPRLVKRIDGHRKSFLLKLYARLDGGKTAKTPSTWEKRMSKTTSERYNLYWENSHFKHNLKWSSGVNKNISQSTQSLDSKLKHKPNGLKNRSRSPLARKQPIKNQVDLSIETNSTENLKLNMGGKNDETNPSADTDRKFPMENPDKTGKPDKPAGNLICSAEPLQKYRSCQACLQQTTPTNSKHPDSSNGRLNPSAIGRNSSLATPIDQSAFSNISSATVQVFPATPTRFNRRHSFKRPVGTKSTTPTTLLNSQSASSNIVGVASFYSTPPTRVQLQRKSRISVSSKILGPLTRGKIHQRPASTPPPGDVTKMTSFADQSASSKPQRRFGSTKPTTTQFRSLRCSGSALFADLPHQAPKTLTTPTTVKPPCAKLTTPTSCKPPYEKLATPTGDRPPVGRVIKSCGDGEKKIVSHRVPKFDHVTSRYLNGFKSEKV